MRLFCLGIAVGVCILGVEIVREGGAREAKYYQAVNSLEETKTEIYQTIKMHRHRKDGSVWEKGEVKNDNQQAR